MWTSSKEVRPAELISENDTLDGVCAAVRQVLRENRRMPFSKTRKCCVGQKLGHSVRTGVKLKRVRTAGQRLTPKFSSLKVGITQSKRSNSSLTIDGKIQGCNYIITLDTGASHSIINSAIIKEKCSPLVEAWFRTATGEETASKGKNIRNTSISDVLMKHEFLVAGIMDEVLLGMDFMPKQGFVLDMEMQVLQYVSLTLTLTVGYARQAEVLQVVVQRQQKIPPNSEAIVLTPGPRELKLSGT
uniref:Peptidase A2 domain-containing protein n=1 Tax=Glossina pallidipes TaxID=7398 RepID=A0A1A9ZNY3_GLOPL